MTETTGGFTRAGARPVADRTASLGARRPAVLPLGRGRDPRPGDPRAAARPERSARCGRVRRRTAPGYHGLPAGHRAAAPTTAGSGPATSAASTRDGYLYVTGRAEGHDHHRRGERLPRGGRAGPARSHPEVADVVVLGEPDPTWGETVVAVGRPATRRPAATPSRSSTPPRGELAGYKRPRSRPHRRRAAAQRVRQGATAQLAAAAGDRRSVRRNSMTANRVRILAFVNHIAPVPEIEADDRAGVRVGRRRRRGAGHRAATGARTGSAPASRSRPTRPPTSSPTCAPHVEHGVPFVFSFGIAGADPHLDTLPARRSTRSACRNGWSLRRRRRPLRGRPATCCWTRIAGGQPVVPRRARCGAVAATDRRRRRRDAERIVALIGPEPVMAALDRGVDGVITGRALDIGLFMALPMLRGIPTAVAAHRRQAAGVRRPGAGARRLGPLPLGQPGRDRASRSGRRRRTPAATRPLAGVAHLLRALPPDAGGEPGRPPRPRRRDLRRDADRASAARAPAGSRRPTPC